MLGLQLTLKEKIVLTDADGARITIHMGKIKGNNSIRLAIDAPQRFHITREPEIAQKKL